MKKTTIVGGGLVGSLLACYLSKRGWAVEVFERRSDPRGANAERGRSINLALSNRGWRVLEKIGLAEKVKPIAIPMKGRFIHNLDGSTVLIPYSTDGQAIYSVSRGDLNRIMIEAADEFEDVNFHFNKRCTNIDFAKSVIAFTDTQTGEKNEHDAAIFFGADGAFSEVRNKMQHTSGFNFSQTYENYAYKELHIPDLNGAWQLEKNALHIFPRGSFMMIALPNMDGSFTCTLFAPLEGENSFATIKTDNDIQHYFEKHFPTAATLMPSLVEDFNRNPTSSLVTMRCFPWSHGNACLIGDAAHAIVPFFGQGMNCGFEDVRILDELLEEGHDIKTVFQKFEISRKPNSDAIADLALYNYIEMRDLSARADFQLRGKIERKIAAAFPDKFQTAYSMVTFNSDMPYSEAQARSQKQGELLDTLMKIKNIETKWDSELVLSMAKTWIENH